MKKCLILLFFITTSLGFAQKKYDPPYMSSKFEQLGEDLPTPNNYRTASGAPGHEYWQQKADYKIKASLNDETQVISGSETITYYNYSPDELKYLWLQLDQNLYDKDSDTPKTGDLKLNENSSFEIINYVRSINSDGGYKISNVKDKNGNLLKYTIVKTMMRIELPQAMKPKTGVFTFSLDWSFKVMRAGRSGCEYFPQDGNFIYEIAQWFPRMAVYYDAAGWQHKQFLGAGEFTLTFGDYEVDLTVPADHIVGATGELQNSKEVLTAEQIKRLEQAKNAKDPVLIVSQAESEQAIKSKSKNTKTWKYKAQNVRDFAWASSRRFIWDAMGVDVNGKKVMAMSLYPKEANPLWGHYSTRTIGLTLQVYSRYTFDYPYPVAYSVNGVVRGGMEYPMISFNGGRPNADGTIPDGVRNFVVLVIIHEVGHNFFPMIVNSDERQWTWMDEGLNTFMQYLTECEVPKQEWAKKDYPTAFPSSQGPAAKIVSYMRSDPNTLVPIMTNSEQILQFGNNAYGKPATALNILRETVMGRELFDYAFKEYARRWAFKHPTPADFFRTMEDASGVDLDWFWRGWFFTTEPCDISIEDVQLFKIPIDEKTPIVASTDTLIKTKALNKKAIDESIKRAANFGMDLSEIDKAMLTDKQYFYGVQFKNLGGLLMPLIVQMKFKDGTSETVRIPAEVWRKNPHTIHRAFITNKEVAQFVLDPELETADIDTENNTFPRKATASKFQEMKEKNTGGK
ncbi:MAG: M1 family metallopeptidase [Microscillaceae bacterium]|jgi:hypothetical protein|nr:M1 family metallopeptidase [Microscillaceae bacterium]